MAHITQSLTWQTLSLHFAIKQTGAGVSGSILLSRIGPFREDGLTRVPECSLWTRISENDPHAFFWGWGMDAAWLVEGSGV